VTNSLGGRLRTVFTTPNPVIPATAVVLALPSAYVAGIAFSEPTAPFFALLLVGVRIPWLADPEVRPAATAEADAAEATDADADAPDSSGDGAGAAVEDADGFPVSTPRAVLWTASTSVVLAAAFLGLYASGVAFGFQPNVASAVAFFVAWMLAEPVVGDLDG